MTKYFFLYAVMISVVLHLSFGGALSVFEKWQAVPKNNNIEITVLDSPSSPSQKDHSKMQIVEQGERANDLVDANAKYLSRNNQKVLRETKAARSGDFQNLGRAGEQPSAALQKTKAPQAPTKALTLKDLLPSYDHLGLTKTATPPATAPTTAEAIPAGQQGSQTSDHLSDVKMGLETMLNTREFVFYSYYDRIRGRLRQYWEPRIRDKVSKVMRKGRRIASHKDHITRVVITLNASGDLIRVQVLEESGVHDLDEAAVEAFRAAAPFPNPPKGIVGRDGTIQIRWDFVLES